MFNGVAVAGCVAPIIGLVLPINFLFAERTPQRHVGMVAVAVIAFAIGYEVLAENRLVAIGAVLNHMAKIDTEPYKGLRKL